jgi:hypothetical protein
VSSEWSEFCFFKRATHSFEIGLFYDKRANAGSNIEHVQLYEKRRAGGKRASVPTLNVESAEKSRKGNRRF